LNHKKQGKINRSEGSTQNPGKTLNICWGRYKGGFKM